MEGERSSSSTAAYILAPMLSRRSEAYHRTTQNLKTEQQKRATENLEPEGDPYKIHEREHECPDILFGDCAPFYYLCAAERETCWLAHSIAYTDELEALDPKAIRLAWLRKHA